MKSLIRGGTLVMVLLMLGFAGVNGAVAQVATTTVSDTVYRADGTPAAGSVVVSWNAFATANGVAVPAGQTTATLGSGGALSLALAPNAGSTPMGSYYTAVYHLNDGTTSREFWVVPVVLAGGAPARLAAIRNQVLPASVAMQTVSKQYVDASIARAQFGPLDTSLYVQKSGDTMTGPLVLPGDPGTSLEAADKNYVDTQVSSVATGLDGKVALLPSTTQTVAQPAGTQLGMNRLNGDLYAAQMQTPGSGGFGIANALADPQCASPCRVVVDNSYVDVEKVDPTKVPNQSQVEDDRGGAEQHMRTNPLSANFDVNGSNSVVNSSRTQTSFATLTNNGTIGSAAAYLTQNAYAGGSNQFPQDVEAPPYFKTTYGVLGLSGNYYTEGQHIQMGSFANCYSVGDCLINTQEIYAAGGLRDPSDEGVHQGDMITQEQQGEYTGVCSSGCTTGSTSVMTSTTYGAGTQGEGRYLIDTNPAKTISSGTVIDGGIDNTVFANYADFSGTSFPVSTFLETAALAGSQLHDVAPGTITLAIRTSGVPAGFATNTAALPASSGLACVRDVGLGESFIEMAPYSVVDGTHLQMTLRKVHAAGSVVAVGGLCGYGVEQTVDTQAGVRQVFPVLGSTSATRLLYPVAGGSILGNQTGNSSSGFANYTLSVASIARTANVVTVVLSAPMPASLNGVTFTVSGVADASYNGAYAVTTTSQTSLTYANTGPDSASTGGTLSVSNGSFVLYPIAEVIGVFDSANNTVDGLMTLAPNSVPWATGDTVEETHFYIMDVYPDTEYITQYQPRPYADVRYGGKEFNGAVGPGMNGWRIANASPASRYLGGGGTHNAPGSAFLSSGVWSRNMEADAGLTSVFSIHCNLHGCNRWDSAYELFQLDARASTDTLTFDPNTDTATWRLYGVPYSFSPTAFTAGTINVGTLNATTITGGIAGSAITSGTIPAARLPLFGPSGTTHAPGAVPDPGAVAGATRFLREDGTWNVPPSGSGGGSPSGSAGGDLGGTYPNPTVSAVHATGGTLDGVAIGTSTAAAAKVSQLTVTADGLTGGNSVVLTTSQAAGAGVLIQPRGGWLGNTNVSLFMGAPDHGLTVSYSDVDKWMTYYGMRFVQNGTPIVGVGTDGTLLSVGSSAQLTVAADGSLATSGTLRSTNAGPGFAAALYTPASSSAACTPGQFADDASFHYVCVATNTWKRVALGTF